ncbi:MULTISPECIES: hypothetical protein [Nocardiaceae]|jgi:hypothetical protein|uniref:Uncharacterized protein n=1 Tax=Rhodococcoides corynebacterioides TaxID=53972 RepID=A0ABS2KW88_9NOCA|nr:MULTISPECIES: hypothetical protein [Rhodococcus]MBM7416193.1 hypothetical protein [Rhodococcus corynebacterioides]MBP1114446.1 hypothetical protein [Rhodococcus sp. PvP016]MBY6680608.1 hypothetical protein [Rhodococcus sp. BP-316]MBY6684955.1 hypothetical protein [Rhodococcus sp. BP-288]MBY6692561.1 hypothetical protein [Rhodococcus sp. BP-188]
MREQRALSVVGTASRHRRGGLPGRRVTPRPGRYERIATSRLIPKRGPATEIEIRFRDKYAEQTALENES